MAELERWFRAVDKDGNGKITSDELQRLSFGGVGLSASTAKTLVRVFDKDNNGTIDFYEYAALHKFLTNMQAAFFQADRDRSGSLDSREIHEALRNGGFDVPYNSVNNLFMRLSGGRPTITFAQFIELVSTIALARSCFELYQPQGGYIRLDFPQLLDIIATF